MSTTTGELDTLVASVIGRPATNKCWALGLDGVVSAKGSKATDFVAAIELAEDANPGTVYRKGASAVLIEKFGITLATSGNVSRHLKRDCKCRPKILP